MALLNINYVGIAASCIINNQIYNKLPLQSTVICIFTMKAIDVIKYSMILIYL